MGEGYLDLGTWESPKSLHITCNRLSIVYSHLAGQGLLLQAAILERGLAAGSHMSGSTSAPVPLFLQTACTIMYPPPHGAEHLQKLGGFTS